MTGGSFDGLSVPAELFLIWITLCVLTVLLFWVMLELALQRHDRSMRNNSSEGGETRG
jgi:hypothetical protein